MMIATMTPILDQIMNFKQKEHKKMTVIILLVVLFFKPILRAVGLINEAMNEGLDKVQEKMNTEVKQYEQQRLGIRRH